MLTNHDYSDYEHSHKRLNAVMGWIRDHKLANKKLPRLAIAGIEYAKESMVKEDLEIIQAELDSCVKN